jgi:hypothetical protein
MKPVKLFTSNFLHKSDFTHVQHQAISAQTEYIYTRIVGLQVLLLQDGQINIVVHILHLRLVRNTMFYAGNSTQIFHLQKPFNYMSEMAKTLIFI